MLLFVQGIFTLHLFVSTYHQYMRTHSSTHYCLPVVLQRAMEFISNSECSPWYLLRDEIYFKALWWKPKNADCSFNAIVIWRTTLCYRSLTILLHLFYCRHKSRDSTKYLNTILCNSVFYKLCEFILSYYPRKLFLGTN